MEGPLGNVGAVWVFCDPAEESDTWASTLPNLRQERIFTWTAKLRPEDWEPPAMADEHAILWRSGKRVSTHNFPGLPRYESKYEAIPNTSREVRAFVSGLTTRSSGSACAAGGNHQESDSWVQAALLMETHFSLSRDFKNTIDLEGRRRIVTSLYLRSCIEAGLLPVIPLNKHPYAGFVIFCPTESYSDVLRDIGRESRIFEGSEAESLIIRFLGQGGDLGYL
ncbi:MULTISPECIES: hypothetical protein [unclassified Streptomyces]|uniref:hypothetical protein n=1 Tax=Streptomyces sp. NPDC127129 TaxID=3345373 RepID=UPI00362A587D